MNVFPRYAKPISRALIVAMIALSAAQYPAEAALVSTESLIGRPAGAESPAARGCVSLPEALRGALGSHLRTTGTTRDTASGINPSGPVLLRLAGPILLRR